MQKALCFHYQGRRKTFSLTISILSYFQKHRLRQAGSLPEGTHLLHLHEQLPGPRHHRLWALLLPSLPEPLLAEGQTPRSCPGWSTISETSDFKSNTDLQRQDSLARQTRTDHDQISEEQVELIQICPPKLNPYNFFLFFFFLFQFYWAKIDTYHYISLRYIWLKCKWFYYIHSEMTTKIKFSEHLLYHVIQN